MPPDNPAEGLKTEELDRTNAGRQKIKNLYNRMEWAGAFGDIGTLIPYIVAYISVLKIDPLGLLFMFGICLLAAGLYYRTPLPVQPMKAIGAAAVAGGINPAALFGSGITTGIFWFLAGATGAIRPIAKLAAKPVVLGIMLGLGLSFMLDGVHRMATAPVLACIALFVTYLLLSNPKVPAMFVLLLIGIGSAPLMHPGILHELAKIHVGFRLPVFALPSITLNDLAVGTLIFTIPQIPLTIGNAVIAIVAENNALFPDRKITEREIALSQGIMNMVSPLFGGVPMCHGAGGMAGHVRFGARTGGAPVILGVVLVLIALFFSDSVSIVFRIFPDAILGVILFFAGSELAMMVKDIGENRSDLYVMISVAAFAMWNMGVAFLAGIILDNLLKRGLIKV
jgi:predicted benzoate:H+ symporter BenE